MPNTRKKARISYKVPDEDDIQEEDFDYGDDEDDRKPPAKKKPKTNKSSSSSSSSSSSKKKAQKQAAAAKKKPPFEMLPQEVLQQVMLYMDDARDIYSLSMVGSKHIRSAITSEIVIRSALFGSNVSQSRITNLLTAVENYSIHIPSTFRMLRIANATTCERLSKCLRHNRETKRAVATPTAAAATKFGMHLCQSCVTGLLDPCPGTLEVKEEVDNNGDLKLTREYKIQYLGNRWEKRWGDKCMNLMVRPELQVEAGTNEMIGPLLDANTYYRQNMVLGDYGTFQGTPVSNEYKESRGELLEYFQAAKDHLPRFIESKKELERQALEVQRQKKDKLLLEARAKSEQRLARKLESQKTVLARLEELLDECPQKVAILHHEVVGGLVHFASPTRIHMQVLMDAPSSATNKKLSEAASSLKGIYGLLEKNGFIHNGTFSIIPNQDEVKSGSLEEAIYSYCEAQLQLAPSGEVQLFAPRRRITYEGLGQPVSALDGFVPNLSRGLAFEAVLSLLGIYYIRRALKFNDSNFMIMDTLWEQEMDETELKEALLDDTAAASRQLRDFWDLLCRARQNYRDYLEREDVMAWKNENSFPWRGWWRFSKPEALRQFSGEGCMQDLLDRNFEALLVKHEEIYQRG